MTGPPTIRSRDNPEIKRLIAAAGGRGDEIVLDGERLIDDALRAGFAIDTVYVAERVASRAPDLERRRVRVRIVADELLDRASKLTTPPGVIALAPPPKPKAIGDLELSSDALVLVAAGVADPGNLGALARSAEAAGAEALIVVAGGARPWNEKALRGSMGSLLRLPVAEVASVAAVAEALDERGFRHLRAATRGGRAPSSVHWSGRVAVWIGGETGSLPAECERFEAVTIPMHGAVESLNVAVAASLLLFAAGRAEEPGR